MRHLLEIDDLNPSELKKVRLKLKSKRIKWQSARSCCNRASKILGTWENLSNSFQKLTLKLTKNIIWIQLQCSVALNQWRQFNQRMLKTTIRINLKIGGKMLIKRLSITRFLETRYRRSRLMDKNFCLVRKTFNLFRIKSRNLIITFIRRNFRSWKSQTSKLRIWV